MSSAKNEGINMRCKPVTTNVFTGVGLIVETCIDIENTNGYLEYIRQPSVRLISSIPVISTSLLSSFLM